jgi:hypothetical protein
MVDTRDMAASLSKQAGILVPEQAVSHAKLKTVFVTKYYGDSSCRSRSASIQSRSSEGGGCE